MFDYDELYGVNIDEYCKYHNITIQDLIAKTKRDIQLLKKRLNQLVKIENRIGDPLVTAVYELLQKKEKHLKRLKNWKRR